MNQSELLTVVAAILLSSRGPKDLELAPEQIAAAVKNAREIAEEVHKQIPAPVSVGGFRT